MSGDESLAATKKTVQNQHLPTPPFEQLKPFIQYYWRLGYSDEKIASECMDHFDRSVYGLSRMTHDEQLVDMKAWGAIGTWKGLGVHKASKLALEAGRRLHATVKTALLRKLNGGSLPEDILQREIRKRKRERRQAAEAAKSPSLPVPVQWSNATAGSRSEHDGDSPSGEPEYDAHCLSAFPCKYDDHDTTNKCDDHDTMNSAEWRARVGCPVSPVRASQRADRRSMGWGAARSCGPRSSTRPHAAPTLQMRFSRLSILDEHAQVWHQFRKDRRRYRATQRGEDATDGGIMQRSAERENSHRRPDCDTAQKKHDGGERGKGCRGWRQTGR
ncbi:hypothetical protein B0H10DRAFT_1946808 [Mycena sp. CBHHK59/15]|nr:hypothetical protein B0H10DRAFT_1946808 [Mycena sp. CBHHK59/15]